MRQVRRRGRLKLGGAPKRRSRVVTAFAWLVALPPVACAVCACAPWLSWRMDIVSNLAAQCLIACAPAALLTLALRRRGPALVGCGSVAVIAGVLAWSRIGAGGPISAEHAANAAYHRASVRVLQFNAGPSNPTPEEALRVVIESGADIVSLIEAPEWLVDAVRTDHALRAIYPHVRISDRAGTGYPLLLTRWPQRGPAPEDPAAWSDNIMHTSYRGMLVALVDHPLGELGIVQVMPRSPRTEARWLRGNERMEDLVSVLDERFGGRESLAWPVVVVGDLNATPTGHRSRRACASSELRRAKPLLVMDGTYPADRRWPLRVAIDDALVSRRIDVESWAVVRGGGSDHMAVLMELGVWMGP